MTLCDGLEWCRTLTAGKFHLHHFQQLDLFDVPTAALLNPAADVLLAAEIAYAARVAVRNLIALQVFHIEMQERIRAGELMEWISDLFGSRAGEQLAKVAS